ncbi:hypothetical protein KKHLCK_00955 [Candidatus Electrothrix laxa]
MSEGVAVPDGWKKTVLEQVAENVSDKFQPNETRSKKIKYVGLENLEPETFKVKTWGYSSDVVSAKNVFVEEDTLFGKLRPYLKKVSLADFKGICSTDILVIRPKQEISPFFLYRILSTDKIIAHSTESSAGNVMPRTSWKELSGYVILVPPLLEQKKIAAILTAVDEVIEKTAAQISKLQDLKKGMMTELLTKGIGHTEFKDSPVGRIPAAWELLTCGDVCRKIEVGIVVKPTKYYQDTGIPALRSANVRENGLNKSNLKFISKKSNELLIKSKLDEGDVVTVRTGYPGTTAVVTKKFIGCNCVDLIISRPSHKVNSFFLSLWINSDFGKGQVLKNQGGLAQQHFNVGDMKKMLIAIPPMGEQNDIVKYHKAMTHRIACGINKLTQTKTLKKALMHDLLTGKKRVRV